MKRYSASRAVVFAAILLSLASATAPNASAQGVTITNSPPPAVVGVPYSFQFQAIPPASYVYSCQCPNPFAPAPGLTISALGAITGTPATSGPFSFSVLATDISNPLNNSGFVVMTIQIAQTPLTINTMSVMDTTRGVSYSQLLAASGGIGTYSWSLTTTSNPLPSGLSVMPAGSIGGTPLLTDTAGSYSFMIQVNDSVGNMASQPLTMTLHNPPITLSPGLLPAGIVNGAYNSGVTASGGTGGPYIYSWAGNTPPNLGINSGTGAITGSPTMAGPFNFTISVTDKSPLTPTFQPQSYSITIYPLITIGPAVIPAADALSNYTQSFTASGGFGSGFTYTISALPPGMNFNGTTGMLGGPPSAAGNDGFTITATDGLGFKGSQNYTLTVNPPLSLAPSTLSSGQVGTSYSQAFTGSGGSGNGYSYSFSGLAIPGLNFSGNTLNGNPSRSGMYPFSITVKDSLGYTAAFPYALTIANPPIIVSPASIPSGQVGVGYLQMFTASGGNGAPYTFSVNPPSPFGLTFASTNTSATLSGAPTSFGTSTVTVTASDGTLSGHTDYTLTIAPATLTLSPFSIPNGTVGTVYSQLFTAAGGLLTYTFSIVGTQPPGIGLTPNGATVTLGGTPTAAGSYTFSVKVTDGSQTATQSFTVTINNQAITLLPNSLPSGIVNGNYSQTFAASGGSGGSYTYSINGSTPGLLLNTATGVLSGAPTSATTYAFTIGVTDNSSFTPVFQPKSYTIVVNPAITVSPATIPAADPGVTYSQTFTASGGTGSGYTYAISALPAGMTLNTTTGLLSGPPSGTTSSFAITATDSGSFSGSQNYTLVVNPALTLSPATLSATQIGTSYSQTFTASGGSGSFTYTFTGTQIAGLNFNNGTLNGTPNTAGNYSFSVTAKDTIGGSVTNNYTLAVNNPPITLIPGSLPAGIVNGSYSQTFTASGGNGGPYTYSINGSTPGLTLNTSTGVLYGAPTSATTYNFTIGVTDNSGFTPTFQPKSYSITVYPAITIAPTTIPPADPGVTYSTTFAASGGTGSGYTYTISALPPGLSLNASTGILSGPPSSSGTFTFTITAHDSQGFTGTSSPIALTVNPALTLAPALTTLPSGQIGTGYSQAFTATGGSGTYTYSYSGTQIAGLSLTSNVFSGTPTTSGTYSFSITAKDTIGGTVSGSYSLTIANSSIIVQPTTLNSGQVGVSYSQTFTASGGNGGPYTFSIVAPAPFGLNFDAATATLSGAPTSSGTASVTISATDGQLTGQRTYTLTVIPAGLTLSPTAIANGTIGVNYTQSFVVSGGSGNYTFTLSPPSPAGLTLSASGNSARLSGAPNMSGSFPLTLFVGDGTLNLSRNYTLAISPSSLSILTTSLPNATESVAYATSLSAGGGTPPYTWAIPGNNLPAGLMLTASGPGAGSISGTPTSYGASSFGVTVTDSLGATASTTLSILVQTAPLTFTTTSPLPPALTGANYSVTFGATGGIGPYSFTLNSGLQGLMMQSGVLSGQLTNTTTASITYNLSITVNDSAKNSATGTFQLTVQPAVPGLLLSAGSLAFSSASGGPIPVPQYVSVSSTTLASPIFSVSTDQPWLSAGPGGGSTPATLQVSINQSGLMPGTYMGNITVTGPDGTHTVSVSLTVNGLPPQLSVAPTIVSFVTDGTSQPESGSIQISNLGIGSITYSVSLVNGSSWVSLGSSPGTVTSAAPVSIPVSAVITGLMPGDYRDVVHIDSSAGSADVPVTLLVAGASTVNLVPSGALYSSRLGQGLSDGTQSFQILTTGTDPVNWTATALGGSGWLTLNTTSGTSSASSPGTVSYTVDPSDLGTGDYYARIHIDSPTASNTPVDFLIVSSVSPASDPATPDPSPAGLMFISSPGSLVPPAQTIQIATSSITPLSFSAAANTFSGGNWLSVSPTTGQTSSITAAQVSVTVNPAGLTPGVYQGSVSFTLQANPTAVRTVNVVLIVARSAPSPKLVSRVATGRDARLKAAAACSPSKLVALQSGLVSNFNTPAGWPTPLEVQLADDCGNAVNTASVVATFSNGDAPLSLLLSDSKNAVYSGTWNPHGAGAQVTVTARAAAPNLQAATAQIVGTISPNKVPILYQHGTIHNLNPLPGAALAPGTIVQIYGSGLAPQALQTVLPLPTNVNGTIVIIGGVQAPLYYVSDGQLDAELPFELQPGRQYQILVSANGALTLPDTLDIEAATPGVAALPDGSIIAQHADFSYVTAASPAHPGEVLTIYLAGMGSTTVPVQTGAQSPSDPLAHTMIQPSVTVNGETAQIAFAGLTPQAVGLYQINFTVPPEAPSGNLKLVVSQGNAASNVSTVIVQQ